MVSSREKEKKVRHTHTHIYAPDTVSLVERLSSVSLSTSSSANRWWRRRTSPSSLKTVFTFLASTSPGRSHASFKYNQLNVWQISKHQLFLPQRKHSSHINIWKDQGLFLRSGDEPLLSYFSCGRCAALHGPEFVWPGRKGLTYLLFPPCSCFPSCVI